MKSQNQASLNKSSEQRHKAAYGASPSGAVMMVTGVIHEFPAVLSEPNSAVDTTVAFPGVAVGDAVLVNSLSPAGAGFTGLILSGYVAQPDVLTVRVNNITTSTLTPSSMQPLGVVVIKPGPGNQ